ncbi:glycosyltransferase [Novosphingobium sp. KCTC 2891]|uniref:glycosyltransferase n=1 Tax=Novosphingobium sp. KCTC 2891 TaxID=2989730 RepID=UPI0022235136|nr:glycosyltransferase [Novosphingobium sp. KCTC 2891]MCW1383263.1 glycosyltransferase [Novosphingobium sp. KCTC 2891]
MSGPLQGLRIGLLSPWASRVGGGVFEAVVRQADMIRAMGGEAPVFAPDAGHVAEDSARFPEGSLTLCRQFGPPILGFAPDLVRRLIEADLDVLHLHGIWMYPSRAGAKWAARTGRGYLVSPHGMLDPWITARGTWKKTLARAGYERASWARATSLHALTGREAQDIRRETGRDEVFVIPNAGPAPSAPRAGLPPPHVTYIGRIHAKKNLLALVEAWKNAALPEGSRLTIAGWGDDADVEALKSAVSGVPTAEFIGPIFGAAKQALIEGSRYIVLPSLSEGLPMAILEAWAAGVPTVMTGECNLPEGFARGAAIECGYAPAEIGAALGAALSIGEADWSGMAHSARALAAETFGAEQVARAWADTYRSAIDRRGR